MLVVITVFPCVHTQHPGVIPICMHQHSLLYTFISPHQVGAMQHLRLSAMMACSTFGYGCPIKCFLCPPLGEYHPRSAGLRFRTLVLHFARAHSRDERWCQQRLRRLSLSVGGPAAHLGASSAKCLAETRPHLKQVPICSPVKSLACASCQSSCTEQVQQLGQEAHSISPTAPQPHA